MIVKYPRVIVGQMFHTSSNNNEVPFIKLKPIVVDFPRNFGVVCNELRLFRSEASQDDS